MMHTIAGVDVNFVPVVVNDVDDYVGVQILSGERRGDMLVVGQFDDADEVADGYATMKFDAFVYGLSPTDSDEWVANNFEFVQSVGLRLIELAVENIDNGEKSGN